MYEFLIAVTILLPKETNSFRVFSPSQYSEPLCTKAAQDMAGRISAITRAKMPRAIVRMEISCVKRETRTI